MSEEEKMARQQVMNIINNNAKNNALKLLRRYHDPYECWTGLKSRYESDTGPRRVMLIDKFFALRKTDSISMDAHLTEVREIANLLEEVDVNIPEDIIVYYTLKHLPKEYEIFKWMQISGQTLPTYEQLEAKMISEETAIKIENQDKDEGEAFFLHRQRRPQSNASKTPACLGTTKTLLRLQTLPGVGRIAVPGSNADRRIALPSTGIGRNHLKVWTFLGTPWIDTSSQLTSSANQIQAKRTRETQKQKVQLLRLGWSLRTGMRPEIHP